MAVLNFWLACGTDGQTRVYESKPERKKLSLGCTNGWRGKGNVSAAVALYQLEQCGMELPLLTYADDPVQITISLSYETSKKE